MKVTDLKTEPKEIITDEELLCEGCDVINPKEEATLLQEIVLALKATIKDKGLIYLTAPQIGYNKRVFCVKFGESDIRTFVNPIVENLANPHITKEVCNSLPGREFLMPRFASVTLLFMTPMGDSQARKFMGMAADIIEHCMHHLDGGLVCDVGLELDELWYKATDEEREEVIEMYMNSLDLRSKAMEEALSQDDELKQISDASKFIESVRSGETTIEKIEDEKPQNEE